MGSTALFNAVFNNLLNRLFVFCCVNDASEIHGLFETSALCPLVSEKSNVFVCDNPDVANLVMKLLKAIVWLYPVNASVITA